MKYNYRKLLISILMMTIIICASLSTFAHSGRTDSNGGHKDNKNVSGLGSYHYHCGGNPPHLHTNGVCPYSSSKATKSTSSNSNSSSSGASNKSSSSSTSKSSTASSTSSSYSSTTSSASNTNTNTTTTKPTTITATEMKIDQDNFSMEIGDTKKLTVSITPDNVTDKNITWKSNDESIATINEEGEITAKKSGVVSIIASTSNGEIDTIVVNVKEKATMEANTTKSDSNTTSEDSSSEGTNPIGGILAVGLVGAGGYWGYKKYKNNKQ